MLIGIPIYGGVDLLDVTGPYEMFSWADLGVQRAGPHAAARHPKEGPA
jgi:hypothetical protein